MQSFQKECSHCSLNQSCRERIQTQNSISSYYTISYFNDDLEIIASWGTNYLVHFNDQKTQFQLMTDSIQYRR